ncbi:MAG TPA: succinate dehydrogenase assembly factor 2 [Burkholderiaceae bacterium]|nr:succinate dehydrogenase assembly factor 2 [Burkholderiaceae bacterium]
MPVAGDFRFDDARGVADPDAPVSVALRRLRWRARRGLLENDLLLGRFFDRHIATLSSSALDALAGLLDLPDGQLLDLVLGRAEPQGALDCATVRELLTMLRSA